MVFATLAAPAQQPQQAKSPAQVTFHIERRGLEVPTYTLTVDEDGTGHYVAEQVSASATASDDGSVPATQHIDRRFALSRKATTQIFAGARDLDRFNTTCASRAKNIADTGQKSLSYTGDDGAGSCEYNYSEDRSVVKLTDTFQAIAATLDIGRKLDFNHRFDRLELDAIIAQLVQEAEAGRAIELGTIAPTLRSLVEDSEVMARVRSRAAKLLLQAAPTS